MAISGRTEAEARDAITSAGRERGEQVPAGFDSTRFCDQARAIEMLGGKLFTKDGQPFEARQIEADRKFPKDWLHSQPTIAQFLEIYSERGCADRMLVSAYGPNQSGVLEAHMFTLDRGKYFDNNTPKCKPINVTEAIKSALAMHIVDVLLVRRPPGRRKTIK